jgi:hypothetical protein
MKGTTERHDGLGIPFVEDRPINLEDALLILGCGSPWMVFRSSAKSGVTAIKI